MLSGYGDDGDAAKGWGKLGVVVLLVESGKSEIESFRS